MQRHKIKIIFLSITLLGLFGRAESSRTVYPIAGRKKFLSFGFIFFIFTIFFSLAPVSPAYGADWYVSKSGNNSTGSNWENAWNELNQINWNSVQAGDNVHIDGGAVNMVYSTVLDVNKAGVASQRITIQRSTEPGRDGAVLITDNIIVRQPYVTIDGKDASKFTVNLTDETGYNINVRSAADFFELKNIKYEAERTGSWGTGLLINSNNALVSHSDFKQTAYEDQIKYGGMGTLTVEFSYFHDLLDVPWITGVHNDVLQIRPPSGPFNLVFRNNRVVNIDGQGIMSTTADNVNNFGNIDVLYNVFSDIRSGVYKTHPGTALRPERVYNNVFHDTYFGSFFSPDVKNNIFTGRHPTNNDNPSPVYNVYSDPTPPDHSLWAPGVGYFYAGNGNIQVDPQFFDSAAGDFRLNGGSPAINAGVDVGLAADILGNPIIGVPDIGVYEYVFGGDTTPPAVPTGLSVL
ncbi:MAG: hypothetical protein NUV83_03030 [Candidatus Wolfebacteria bacterium]|nr:hypothetical protein [Candidatus Wolfebacteria bacterium]